MTTQEITVRISKTVQEQQYEPITAEVIIKETCPKKKYGERIDELLDLASTKVFGYLGDDSVQPESDEEYAEEGEKDLDANEEPLEEEGFEEGQGEENYKEEGQGEENYKEEGQGEENYEGEGQGEEGAEDEFGDFFEDDPDGEEN
jgi:hypothetical protein